MLPRQSSLASSSVGTSSSVSHPPTHDRQGSLVPRYKAVTRDLLLSICKKHFSNRAVGASISGSNREAKAAARAASHEGEEFTGLQTRTESLEHYLKRATHLQLDHLKLTHTHVVPELASATGQPPNDRAFSGAKVVRVLYLHDNLLTSLEDLSFCGQSLSHLYLQSNHIARMENLLPLQALEKLYLGNNRIQVLEGFAQEEQQQQQQQGNDRQNQEEAQEEDLHQQQQQPSHRPSSSSSLSSHRPGPISSPAPFYLVELHMDSQKLPANVGLQLSIPSIQALSDSLKILSLANNQMTSDDILPISLLGRLTQLNLNGNRIDDVKLVAEMCSYLPDLTTFDLRDNPLNSGPGITAVMVKKYRDKVIMSSRSISLLDDKPVPSNQREYLHSLREQKRLARIKASQERGEQEVKMSEEERRFAALHAPPAFPYAPKVLTLRNHTLPGEISVGQLGAFGQTHGGGFGSTAAQAQQQYSHQQQSPFLDDDPNLTGGGGGGAAAGIEQGMSELSVNQQEPELDPYPGGPFKGSTKRLEYLLQTRGLVSAIGPKDDGTSAESARARRATSNALNQRPGGWDGGRTQHIIPQVQSRSNSSIGHQRNASSPTRTNQVRTSSKTTTSGKN